MDKIQVLDHGHVGLIESMGGDLSIVRNARVSYDAEWRAGEDEGSDARLIRYLMKNGHNTPFESTTVTFDIKAPIFVLRQWHRHRTQSYNELSARYRPLPEEFYVPEEYLMGKQSEDNKQMRSIVSQTTYLTTATPADLETNKRVRRLMREHNRCAFDLYREFLAEGVPRELARTVLPVATYSHMFATANLHNWFNFLRERLHPHAQYEIRVYAEAMLEFLRTVAPVATAAFESTMETE